MSDEAFGPEADRYKYTREDRRHNADNHNGMLLGRGISIDDHFARQSEL